MEHIGLFDDIFVRTDLRHESVPGEMIVELLGSNRLILENHHGINVYEHNEIHVKVKRGIVVVAGDDLTIVRMNKEQLVIVGQLKSIMLHRGEAGESLK